jgi:hypothetical protein
MTQNHFLTINPLVKKCFVFVEPDFAIPFHDKLPVFPILSLMNVINIVLYWIMTSIIIFLLSNRKSPKVFLLFRISDCIFRLPHIYCTLSPGHRKLCRVCKRNLHCSLSAPYITIIKQKLQNIVIVQNGLSWSF